MRAVVGLAACWLVSLPASADAPEGQLLEGSERKALGMVTGVRTVAHKKSGFEVRLIEADGSASVAHDPVSLYLVVTDNGTSDLQERVWRIPRGVARVRSLVASACGADVRVDVDGPKVDGRTAGVTRTTLRFCFLAEDGALQRRVLVTEIPPK